MQAMTVRRLADSERVARLYLDGKRVTRKQWDAAHSGKRTDTYATRMDDRGPRGILVRQFHCIRTR